MCCEQCEREAGRVLVAQGHEGLEVVAQAAQGRSDARVHVPDGRRVRPVSCHDSYEAVRRRSVALRQCGLRQHQPQHVLLPPAAPTHIVLPS